MEKRLSSHVIFLATPPIVSTRGKSQPMKMIDRQVGPMHLRENSSLLSATRIQFERKITHGKMEYWENQASINPHVAAARPRPYLPPSTSQAFPIHQSCATNDTDPQPSTTITQWLAMLKRPLLGITPRVYAPAASSGFRRIAPKIDYTQNRIKSTPRNPECDRRLSPPYPWFPPPPIQKKPKIPAPKPSALEVKNIVLTFNRFAQPFLISLLANIPFPCIVFSSALLIAKYDIDPPGIRSG